MHENWDLSNAVLQPGACPGVRRPWIRSVLRFVAFGLGITALGCRDEVTDPGIRPDSVVVSIEMLPAERLLSFIGMTDKMGARRVAADGSWLGASNAFPERFSWSSDASDVVTVDGRGLITAMSEGTARISATSDGVTGTATVTVRDAIRLAWSFPLDGYPGGLAIGQEGTIYAAAGSTLNALGPGGQSRGGAHAGASVNSAPAIAPDGTLYVGMSGTRGSLMAIDRSGAVRWTLENTGWISTSPAIGSDGTIYAASWDSTLYAVDSAGQKRWEAKAGDRPSSSPAVAHDGTILVSTDGGYIYAVNPDGTERWTFQAADTTISSSAAVAVDGTIYFGSPDGHLYALTPERELKWRLPLLLGRQATGSPAIGSDGTVYIGGEDALHAVDPGGQLRWAYRGTNPTSSTRPFGSPIVAGDGSIYVAGGASRKGMFALNADGTLKWDYPVRGPIVGVPAIGLDGTIFAASSDTTRAATLYAIVERGASNGGFASAPWPKERGDRSNTGRVGGP